MIPTWLTDTVTSDLDRALHYTALWGLEGVELRTVGGVEDRVPFVNEAKLKRRLREQSLPVCAIVPGLFEGSVKERAAWLNEIALMEETLAFCRRIGCSRIVVSAFGSEAGVDPSSEDVRDEAVEALQRAGAAAAKADVRLVVLNETGMAHATGGALGRLLEAVDHPAVRAAWSPAEALRNGEDPAEGLEALGDRVELVRCSDGSVEAGGWQEAPLGEGDVRWAEHLRRLHELGFSGPVSLEVYLEPRPKQGLQSATRLIQMIRAATRR